MPKNGPQFLAVQTYIPAVLKEYNNKENGYCIEFYAINPVTNKLVLQRIKLNRERKKFSKLSDFRKYANFIVQNINNKLAGGWTPFFESENTRLYTPLEDVIKTYLDEKKQDLRHATYISYNSMMQKLKFYCNDNLPNIRIGMFNKLHALNYLNYCNKNKIKARTYNNIIKQSFCFFEWCKENLYIKENPFISIKKKREEQKERILIDPITRKTIDDYLKKNNKPLRLVSHLVFSALIRPKEAALIQIKDINIEKKYITINGQKSKNHYTRCATISEEIIEQLKELHLDKYKSDYYLFGALTSTPGKTPFNSHTWSKQWDKMKKTLNLPDNMQLYSLRDSGINNMIKAGIDPLTVMQHADHHSLDITTRYANHIDENLNNIIYNKAPKF